jgi:hypothetical protein
MDPSGYICQRFWRSVIAPAHDGAASNLSRKAFGSLRPFGIGGHYRLGKKGGREHWELEQSGFIVTAKFPRKKAMIRERFSTGGMSRFEVWLNRRRIHSPAGSPALNCLVSNLAHIARDFTDK